MIWKFRLITLVPVVMSLFGSVSCFVIGTYAEISVLSRVFQGHFTHTNSTLLIGKVVGGIDYYLKRAVAPGLNRHELKQGDPCQPEQTEAGRHDVHVAKTEAQLRTTGATQEGRLNGVHSPSGARSG